MLKECEPLKIIPTLSKDSYIWVKKDLYIQIIIKRLSYLNSLTHENRYY